MTELPSPAAARRAVSPTLADLVDRARALAPALGARARDAEAQRRLPAATVRAFESSELCRIWVPRRYGGFEMAPEAGLDTVWEIARACASSAWCLTVYQQHNWLIGHFPDRAQDETLGAEPNLHVGAVLAPRGKARKVPGGYELTGRWPFASGCDHGTWIILGALVVDDAGAEIKRADTVYGLPAVNAVLTLVPIGAVTNTGDWNAAGLSATGSHSIVADGIFVPEHRTLAIPDAVENRSPGAAVNRGPLWRVPYYPFLVTALAAPAVGVAEGALAGLVDRADKRVVPPINLVAANLVRTHRQIGDAEARIAAARALLVDNARRVTAHGEAGTIMPVRDRAQCRNAAAFAVELCYEAVEIAFFAAGGGALDLAGPVQRAMRDIHAIKAHYFMDVETTRELAGMLALGKAPFTYAF
jgi:3-hydroxy-9,10-secoandrosta-1,3,5(10)-triene-9,17-dione monooxygenase